MVPLWYPVYKAARFLAPLLCYHASKEKNRSVPFPCVFFPPHPRFLELELTLEQLAFAQGSLDRLSNGARDVRGKDMRVKELGERVSQLKLKLSMLQTPASNSNTLQAIQTAPNTTPLAPFTDIQVKREELAVIFPLASSGSEQEPIQIDCDDSDKSARFLFYPIRWAKVHQSCQGPSGSDTAISDWCWARCYLAVRVSGYHHGVRFMFNPIISRLTESYRNTAASSPLTSHSQDVVMGWVSNSNVFSPNPVVQKHSGCFQDVCFHKWNRGSSTKSCWVGP